MEDRRGTRRVYFKDMFYEANFTALPSENWATLGGTNNWNLKPSSYLPYSSNYHMGHYMDCASGSGWHSAIATQNAAKYNSTDQPYLDPTTTDGGLEPVIYEVLMGHDADAWDMAFVFYYDTVTNVGYALRIRPNVAGVSEYIELYKVDLSTPTSPTWGAPLWSQSIGLLDSGGYKGKMFRIYYTPVDVKYGGDTIASAGTFRLFMSEAKEPWEPKEVYNYLEGIAVAGSTNFRTVNWGDIYTDGSPLTNGTSLVLMSNGIPSTDWSFGNIKYCRHWDYGIASVRSKKIQTFQCGTLEVALPKPKDVHYGTEQDGQIGYEVGDRIEFFIKTRQRTYADPPVETLKHVCEFDGLVIQGNNQGSGTNRNRADVFAADYYYQLIKWGEDFSFVATTDLETAFQTITGAVPENKYETSAMNQYGIDSGLSTTTFAGAKDYKGLSAFFTWLRMLIFADVHSWWHPMGTLCVTSTMPNDASRTLNMDDSNQNDFIVDVQMVQDGSGPNSVQVFGSATDVTRQDSGIFDRYGRRGISYIDSRESNATDMNTIGDNIYSAWKHKRKIFDVYTYQGKGEIQVGDRVSCTFTGFDVSANNYQVIEKECRWGEKFRTTSGLIRFRLCEVITGEPSVPHLDNRAKRLRYWEAGYDGLAQHA